MRVVKPVRLCFLAMATRLQLLVNQLKQRGKDVSENQVVAALSSIGITYVREDPDLEGAEWFMRGGDVVDPDPQLMDLLVGTLESIPSPAEGPLYAHPRNGAKIEVLADDRAGLEGMLGAGNVTGVHAIDPVTGVHRVDFGDVPPAPPENPFENPIFEQLSNRSALMRSYITNARTYYLKGDFVGAEAQLKGFVEGTSRASLAGNELAVIEDVRAALVHRIPTEPAVAPDKEPEGKRDDDLTTLINAALNDPTLSHLDDSLQTAQRLYDVGNFVYVRDLFGYLLGQDEHLRDGVLGRIYNKLELLVAEDKGVPEQPGESPAAGGERQTAYDHLVAVLPETGRQMTGTELESELYSLHGVTVEYDPQRVVFRFLHTHSGEARSVGRFDLRCTTWSRLNDDLQSFFGELDRIPVHYFNLARAVGSDRLVSMKYSAKQLHKDLESLGVRLERYEKGKGFTFVHTASGESITYYEDALKGMDVPQFSAFMHRFAEESAAPVRSLSEMGVGRAATGEYSDGSDQQPTAGSPNAAPPEPPAADKKGAAVPSQKERRPTGKHTEVKVQQLSEFEQRVLRLEQLVGIWGEPSQATAAYHAALQSFGTQYGYTVPDWVKDVAYMRTAVGIKRKDLSSALRRLEHLARDRNVTQYNTPEERNTALWSLFPTVVGYERELKKTNRVAKVFATISGLAAAAGIVYLAAVHFPEKVSQLEQYIFGKQPVVVSRVSQEEAREVAGAQQPAGQEYQAPAPVAPPAAPPIDPRVSLYNHVMEAMNIEDADQQATRLREVLSTEGCAVLGSPDGILTTGKGSHRDAVKNLYDRIVNLAYPGGGAALVNIDAVDRIMRAYNFSEITNLPTDVDVKVIISCGGTE